MKTINKVNYKPIYIETMPDVFKQGYVYISEKYKTSSHLCLCGCGEKVILPLNYIIFPTHWRLIKEDNDTVSFTPSVGNYSFNCQSHYIMTKNVANFV